MKYRISIPKSLCFTHKNTHISPHTHLLYSTHQKSQKHVQNHPHFSKPEHSKSTASENACKVFDEMSNWDVISATAIIGRFIKQNRHEEAMHLFSRMLQLDIMPNEFTFGTIIHSCVGLHDLYLGKQLHACAIKMGLDSNVFAGSAFLNFYAKLSTVEEARRVFETTRDPNVVSYTTLICGYLKKERFDEALTLFREMPEQNVVSWNAIIGGYSKTGRNEEAVDLFIRMLRDGMFPSQSTFPCVISAAASIAALGMGRSFHACAIKFLGYLDLFIGNSLISFYAKCGSMEDSLIVFDKILSKNIVSWNAIICGYAHNGRGNEAIEFFQKMQKTNHSPNGVTLLGLLLACNHAGLVNEANLYFNMMRVENPSVLNSEHYASMVNIFSRSGRFREASEFLCHLPFDPGIGFWKAVLGGCQIHSNLELGEVAAKKILELDPEDVSSYIMLSNAYVGWGNWEGVSMIRKEIKERAMKRTPGCSWIEIRSRIHNFVTGDKNHEHKDDIYRVLRLFLQHIKESSQPCDHLLIDF